MTNTVNIATFFKLKLLSYERSIMEPSSLIWRFDPE